MELPPPVTDLELASLVEEALLKAPQAWRDLEALERAINGGGE